MMIWWKTSDESEYLEYPNKIGRTIDSPRGDPKQTIARLKKMEKGDRLIYSVKGDKVIGVFEVSSNWIEEKSDPKWGHCITVGIRQLEPKVSKPVKFDRTKLAIFKYGGYSGGITVPRSGVKEGDWEIIRNLLAMSEPDSKSLE